MILLQHEVRTPADLSDLELLMELRRRPALRASVLAELTKAELVGEAARKGRLLLEQPSTYCSCPGCEGRHQERQ